MVRNSAMYGKWPYTRCMASALKSERIELRLTTEQKRTIERAATISGRTVTDFSVPYLVEQAREIIRQDRELQLSNESWDRFQQILDQPAQSLPGLAALLRRRSVFTD